MRRTVQIAGGIESLFGTLDENLKLFESALRVTTHLQDDKLAIDGEPAQVERAVRILDEHNELVHEGRVLDNGAVKALLRVVTEEPNISLRGILQPGRPRAFGKKSITPKSANQRRYMEFIERYDMVFAIGPGGTGKTYLAVAMAMSSLLTKQVNRIILARPAVEAGERLGFLPGTLQQKIDPYMRPLYDALYDMLDADKLERYLEKGIIEVAPLAFMRGRTLNDSFVILDEGIVQRAPAHERYLRDPRRGAEYHQRADEDVSDAPGIQLQGRHHGRHHADRPAQQPALRPRGSRRRGGEDRGHCVRLFQRARRGASQSCSADH